ncbi:xanthine dehydrogenase family protein molybdopterin-binding subunit [Methylobrevis pamukkalensis]|uniref:xanthine dehydrogenase family protein molybdopterin-binding subunit n=1 Tax=Methylobrevis pamukkalensis TaxID=1439726 RepID=UPI00114CF3A1|nr:molybdopterin cofactor-binding domain-containing protein [Methylobrevis pamukkalensis]
MFGIDVAPPNLLYAAVRHAPVFGATVARVANEAAVRALPGVIDVAVIDGRAVAVVAASWWRAERAAADLEIAWSRTDAAAVDSAALRDDLLAGLESAEPYGHIDEGNVDAALSAPQAKVVEADYDVPFVTHACMEPINATALLLADGTAEVWASSQTPVAMRGGATQGMGWAGVTPTRVVPHVTMAGGAFGRRSDRDVIAEAAFLAARHRGRPVKLIWSREEDIGRGLYRSHAAARLAAALGPDGLPVAYDARVAAQAAFHSIAGRNFPVTPGPDGEFLTVEGLDKRHYSIPYRRMRSQQVPSHVPIHFWRSNGFSFNTFFSESFVDECALAAGTDPLAYRRNLLRDSPRHRAVLDRAAEVADWARPLPPGRGRGIAIEECYRSVVAQVVEVTALGERGIRVDRVVCALDAGLILNPDQVVAQIEGGILFALTTALLSRISFEQGAVVESNFTDYPMLRLATAPDIEVALVDSPLPPCGVGEPGVVPTAAALANAIHAATGRRLRSLPLDVTVAGLASDT